MQFLRPVCVLASVAVVAGLGAVAACSLAALPHGPTGAAIAIILCLLPALAVEAWSAVVRRPPLAAAVVALTFVRPLIGLVGVLVCGESAPQWRPALLVGLAFVYPSCLAVETWSLLRLTKFAPVPKVPAE
ncbi:MAG: hypothetical protein AAF532_10405 [Planctomycetota bacterium]